MAGDFAKWGTPVRGETGGVVTWALIDAPVSDDALPVEDEFAHLVPRAFDAWAEGLDIRFEQVADWREADISVGRSEALAPRIIGVGRTETVGDAIVSAEIRLAVSDRWHGGLGRHDGFLDGHRSFYATMLEEIGQAIGIGYLSPAYAIMRGGMTYANALSWRDVEAGVRLYGMVEGEGSPGRQVRVGDDLDNALHGGGGADDLLGEGGADRLFGGAGRDWIKGGPGDDQAFGGAGRDDVDGGAGDDQLRGGRGNDDLTGGEGDDLLFGGDGDDGADGGDGADRLIGGRGDDDLRGDAGEDFLFGGRGRDQMHGGAGADVFVWRAGPRADRVWDWDDGDRIELRLGDGVSGEDITVEARGSGVMLRHGDEALRLFNVDPEEIDAADFLV